MNMIQERWEKRATVRSRPRLVFDPEGAGYFYPLSHQPLAMHPLLETIGEKGLQYLLAQSLYKYSNDIAVIETRVVNQTILSVITNSTPIEFSSDQKIDLYTVMVDEAYHAYVAYDAMLQIQEYTGIKPVTLPKTIEIEKAMNYVYSVLPQQYHSIFNLIAVCLAENTLTKDIVSMIDKEETHPFFQRLIKDHLSDESRHSGIFFKLLRYIWSQIDHQAKEEIAKILPEFLERYLGLSVQTEFDKLVLSNLGFNDQQCEEIIQDTYGNFQMTANHPMLSNILVQLDKSDVLEGPVREHLTKKGWL